MFAITFAFLTVLGSALAHTSLVGVDPNSLSCDPAGQVFLLLPHFTDCAKFYICDHGKEVEMLCAAGTVFDFHLQTCNHEWATPCWLRSNEIEEEEGSVESGSGSGEGSGDFEWLNSEELPSVGPLAHLRNLALEKAVAESVLPATHFAAKLDCNNARDAARSIPFQGDCQRFWRCQDGLPVSFYCSDGLFFNERSQQCDFEANVRCLVTHEEELQGEFMLYQ